MEYWDNKGQVYNDKQAVLSPMKKAYNKALAVSTNAWDWANETNPESEAYKQKINTILGAELAMLPVAKFNPGIKKLLNSGIDYEAARIFNADDGIKRKFLTEQGALNYFKKMYPDETFIPQKPELTRLERNIMRKEGKKYAKENLKGTNINIPGYTTVDFTGKNVGEDYPHNMPDYPTLKDALSSAKYAFSTNYKRENDRLYDHLINPESKAIMDYLTEVIQDTKGNILHNYKMMKNLSKGDKP